MAAYGTHLPIYRIEFVDHGENVRGTDEIACDADGEAIALAHDRDIPTIGNGFDLWHQERLVHRHRGR